MFLLDFFYNFSLCTVIVVISLELYTFLTADAARILGCNTDGIGSELHWLEDQEWIQKQSQLLADSTTRGATANLASLAVLNQMPGAPV